MSGQTLNRLEKTGALATPDECEGCGKGWAFGGWQLHHGWARCAHCGTEYCIIDYAGDDNYNGPEMVFSEKFAEAVSGFYSQHEERWDRSMALFREYLEREHEELAEALEREGQL